MAMISATTVFVGQNKEKNDKQQACFAFLQVQ